MSFSPVELFFKNSYFMFLNPLQSLFIFCSLRFSRESHVEYGQEGLCVCVKPSLQSSDRDRGGPDASRARGRCSECVCCPHVVHRWLSQCLSLVASSSADLPAVARCPARNPRVWSSLRRLHTLHKAPFVSQLHFYFS